MKTFRFKVTNNCKEILNAATEADGMESAMKHIVSVLLKGLFTHEDIDNMQITIKGKV